MSAPAVPRDETAGAGPRARLAGLIGAALRGLGRVHRRHGAALGVVLLVGLFAGLVGLAALRPVPAWDMIAYLGAAWRDAFADPAALHEAVYAAVRADVADGAFRALAEGDSYRLRQSGDPAAFSSMLGMYAVKWLYVRLFGLLVPVFGPVMAGLAINAASAAVFLAVLLWWLRAVGLLNLAPAVAALLLLAGLPAMVMAPTPDLLTASLVVAGFLFLDRGHAALANAALLLAVLTRPDQAASVGVLMAFLWLLGDRQAPSLALGFAGAVAAYVFATHGSQHPGWWPHLWFSTYRIQDSMDGFAPAFSPVVYAVAFAWNLVRALVEDSWLALMLGTLTAWALLEAGGLRFSSRRTALAGAALTAIAAKFVLFPLHDGRTAFPLIVPAMLLVLVEARDAARRRAAG